MDTRNWKKVLLQWVTQCGFTERNYMNIEQSDIDTFFNSFVKNHKKANSEKRKSLLTFLKEIYPDFQPHLSEDGTLSPLDYMYVYSLLLHYSCVRQPENFFHEACKNLPEGSQLYIADFFKQLLDSEVFTRDVLRQAISNISNNHLEFTPPQSSQHGGAGGNYTNGCGSGGSGDVSGNANNDTIASRSVRLNSPVRTPARSDGSFISPSTPKTSLLEMRTREIYSLRAQLETEHYDKGLLELQIKQNEEKIKKMAEDYKKLQNKIKDMKVDMYNVSSDSSTCVDDDYQVKCKLMKDISQKEEEINRLSDIVETLTEENSLTKEMLTRAEEKVKICIQRIEELELKILDIKRDSEHKDGIIKYLNENKLELEEFINEAKGYNRRQDLNSTADCLDNSYVRSVNSSTSPGSPENLGKVVEVQLREKENENSKLLATIETFKTAKQRVVQKIQDMIKEQSKLINVETTDKDKKETEADKKVEELEPEILQLNVLGQLLEQLGENYTTGQQMIIDLQNETVMLSQRIQTLGTQTSTLSNELTVAKTNNHRIVGDKKELEIALNNAQHRYEQLRRDNKDVLDQIHVDHEQTMHRLHGNINSLQSELSKAADRHEEELRTLREQLELHKSAEQTIENNYKKLSYAYEELKSTSIQTDAHLEMMRTQLNEKNDEMKVVGDEIVEMGEKNAILGKRCSQLLAQHDEEIRAVNEKLDESLKKIEELEKEKNHLRDQCNHTKAKYLQCSWELEALNKDAETLLNALNLDVWQDAMLEVCELIDYKSIAKAQLEQLTVEVKHLREQSRLAQDDKKIIAELDEKLQNADLLVEEQRATIKVLKSQQHNFQNKIITDLQTKEKELNDRLTITQSEHKVQLAEMQQTLDTAIEEGNLRVNELKAMIKDYNNLRDQFNNANSDKADLDNQLKQTHNFYRDRMRELQNKIKRFTESNANNIGTFETDPSDENSSHDACDNKMLLLQTERILENVSVTLLNKIKSLNNRCELIKATLEGAENRIRASEQTQREQLEQIKTLEFEVEDLEKKYIDSTKVIMQLSLDNQDMANLLIVANNKSEQHSKELQEAMENKKRSEQELQTKLCLSIEKLTKQTEELESNETEILELISTITGICARIKHLDKLDCPEEDNIFSDVDGIDTLSRLRAALNQIFNINLQYGRKYQQMKSKLENGNEKNADLTRQLEIVRNAMKNLEIAKNAETAQRQDLEFRQTAFKNRIKAFEGDFLSLDKTIHELQRCNKKTEFEYEKVLLRFAKIMREKKNMKSLIKRLKNEKDKLKRKCRTQSFTVGVMRSKQDELLHEVDMQRDIIVDNQHKYSTLLSDFNTLSDSCDKLKVQTQQDSETLRARRTEIIKLEADLRFALKNYHSKRKACDDLTNELEVVKRDLNAEREKNAKQKDDYDKLQADFNTLSARFNALEVEKSDAERNLRKVTSDNYLKEQQLVSGREEIEKLLAERFQFCEQIEEHVEELEQCRTDLEQCQTDLREAQENVSKMLEQLESMRKEKEAACDEIQSLRTKLRESNDNQTLTDAKLKSMTEQSQAFERKLLTTENELSSKRNELEKSQQQAAKYYEENRKLRDLNETLTKRVEKFAVKLGDAQAVADKLQRDITQLQRDNTQLQQTIALQSNTITNLQRDKDGQQVELKLLRERSLKAERQNEAINAKCIQMEEEFNQKIRKAEKNREGLEEKVRKMDLDLQTAEQINVNLNLEIGGLNSCHMAQITELSNQLQLVQNEIFDYRKNIEILTSQNDELKNKLTKISSELSISVDNNNSQTTDLENLRIILCTLRSEKAELAEEYDELKKSLDDLKKHCDKLRETNDITNEKLSNQIALSEFMERRNTHLQNELERQKREHDLIAHSLEQEVNEKCVTIANLRAEIGTTRVVVGDKHRRLCKVRNASTDPIDSQDLDESEDNAEPKLTVSEMRKRLADLEAILNDERSANGQLRYDNQILQAKYRSTKERLAEEDKMSAERIKENRLEMEGKLDKMKTKMDGPHSLDDSMSALLSTTNGGGAVRKKITGTHYKRPGPPTPSKHGGRLSFGSSEPAREILKETYDGCHNNGTVTSSSSAKTPSRFGMFASRFSMGNGNNNYKDEKYIPKKLKKYPFIKNMRKENKIGDISNLPFCTSTPRKSRSYFDSRRTLLLKDAEITPTTPLTMMHTDNDGIVVLEMRSAAMKIPKILPGGNSETFNKNTYAPLPAAQSAGFITPTITSTMMVKMEKTIATKSTASSASGETKRQRKRYGRPSLCLPGKIFARTTRKIERIRRRTDTHKQRFENFNQYRQLETPNRATETDDSEQDTECEDNESSEEPATDELEEENYDDDENYELELGMEDDDMMDESTDATYDIRNNNYSYHNHNNSNKYNDNSSSKSVKIIYHNNYNINIMSSNNNSNNKKNIGETVIIDKQEPLTYLTTTTTRTTNDINVKQCGGVNATIDISYDVVVVGDERIQQQHVTEIDEHHDNALMLSTDPSIVVDNDNDDDDDDDDHQHEDNNDIGLDEDCFSRLLESIQIDEQNDENVALVAANNFLPSLPGTTETTEQQQQLHVQQQNANEEHQPSKAEENTQQMNFEQVCCVTTSNAPFKLTPIVYDSNNDEQQHKSTTINNNEKEQLEEFGNVADDFTHCYPETIVRPTENMPKEKNNEIYKCGDGIVTETPSILSLSSSASASTATTIATAATTTPTTFSPPPTTTMLSTTTKANLSRTIYSGRIIYNHRLPTINTTYVRKSSIYIKDKSKNKQSIFKTLSASNVNDTNSDQHDSASVVLVTNQTITILDLWPMWQHMDTSVRYIVLFALFAMSLLSIVVIYTIMKLV